MLADDLPATFFLSFSSLSGRVGKEADLLFPLVLMGLLNYEYTWGPSPARTPSLSLIKPLSRLLFLLH